MAARKRAQRKADALRDHSSLNPRPEAVDDELFETADFFDPRDLLQVKYEMVRRVRVDGEGVSHAAQQFGFSRPTVYQALSAFEQGGLAALLPRRPGPRRAHKLNEEVVEFLVRKLDEEPELRADDLVCVLQERFGLSVHPRSIERALRRGEKKRP